MMMTKKKVQAVAGRFAALAQCDESRLLRSERPLAFWAGGSEEPERADSSGQSGR